MSDYLYDKEGPPDPDVAKLEELLGGFRYDRPPPAPRVKRRRPFLVATGVVALAAAAALIFWLRRPEQRTVVLQPESGWRVVSLAGAARCGGASCSMLRPGEWLETSLGARARVTVADIGEMEVEGSSRLRLVATGPQRHHLELQKGVIEAVVDAPPRLLVVDTPTTTAVDLGCAYRLSVDEDGVTRISVSSGWVALEGGGHATMVPAGASARSTRGAGPGLPLYDDAHPTLVAAAARLDADAGDTGALDAALASARPEDALTIWHLIPRVADGQPRVRVVAWLAELRRPASLEKIMNLDPDALERWREELEGL
jgi:ferric-dicitrate binding protein FerR (iron transport regulator)